MATDTSVAAKATLHRRGARTLSHSPAVLAGPPAAMRGRMAAAYSGVSVLDIDHPLLPEHTSELKV
jgi:hypothetical protein